MCYGNLPVDVQHESFVQVFKLIKHRIVNEIRYQLNIIVNFYS